MTNTNTTYKWAVYNRETGKLASMREFNYGRKARFETRDQARTALREGRVYQDTTQGKVAKISN